MPRNNRRRPRNQTAAEVISRGRFVVNGCAVESSLVSVSSGQDGKRVGVGGEIARAIQICWPSSPLRRDRSIPQRGTETRGLSGSENQSAGADRLRAAAARGIEAPRSSMTANSVNHAGDGTQRRRMLLDWPAR